MKIWAHTLVKNEERFLWYSVCSVIEYVDKLLLWDSGSTDNTIQICELLRKKFPDRVDFHQVEIASAEEFPRLRQRMLDETRSDWFLVVDGDEVWWKDSIKMVVGTIYKKGKQIESIVVPMIYPIGDIYHRQEEAAGKYRLAGKKGHVALRAVSRAIPGLSSLNPHGTWGWTDGDGKMIQDRDPGKILFIPAPYMHLSHLPRAGTIGDEKKVIKRPQKLKMELGAPFPKDYYYPEVFFKIRPEIVPSPWRTMTGRPYFLALVETPLRKIKRRIFSSPVGY